MDDRKHLPPLAKLALDIGPLVLFFVVNGRWGIYAATGIFMVAVIVALIVSYVMIRRFPVMTVLSAVIVMVFGGLTIWLQDDTFIKMKPTIIYALFAGVLGIGLLMKKPLLATVFDAMFHLTDEGWHKLTIRWALFFVFMAVLNEIVWRTQSTDFWVGFKLFGAIPLTFVFALLQYPLMAKYDASGEKKAAE
jgi:intracellular septation protein